MKASCVRVQAYRCHVLALWLNNLALMCCIVGVERGIHDSLHSNGFCSPTAQTRRHDLCFYELFYLYSKKNPSIGQSNNRCIPRLPRCIKTKDSKFTLSTLSKLYSFYFNKYSNRLKFRRTNALFSYGPVPNDTCALAITTNPNSQPCPICHFSFRKMFMTASFAATICPWLRL